MRGYYESQVRQISYRLGVIRTDALFWRHSHRDSRQEKANAYFHCKNHLTYAREQLARCQPTKKG